MSATQTTTVDLIRHGEPVGGRRYRGQTDDPLSDKGWQQMRAAVDARGDWDVIASSPLMRCADFARELAQQRGTVLEIDPRWQEVGFGVWEGRTPEALAAEDADLLARFLDDPVTHAPVGAEPLSAFLARVTSAWSELIVRHRGKRILLVVHAGVIRMVLSHILEIPLKRVFRLHVSNAAVTRIRVEHRGAQLFPQLLFHASR